MRTLKTTPGNRELAVRDAIKVLRSGGVIVYPTDTVYGLGADIRKKKAVDKVYRIKGRTAGKPLSVLVSGLKAARKLAAFDARALRL